MFNKIFYFGSGVRFCQRFLVLLMPTTAWIKNFLDLESYISKENVWWVASRNNQITFDKRYA